MRRNETEWIGLFNPISKMCFNPHSCKCIKRHKSSSSSTSKTSGWPFPQKPNKKINILLGTLSCPLFLLYISELCMVCLTWDKYNPKPVPLISVLKNGVEIYHVLIHLHRNRSHQFICLWMNIDRDIRWIRCIKAFRTKLIITCLNCFSSNSDNYQIFRVG